MINHAANNYDDQLDSPAGAIGRNTAQWTVRGRVYEAIATAYPWLADECDRQQAERERHAELW